MIDLFNNLTELKEYVGVNQSLELDSIKGKFYDAGRKYLVEWMGETTYNALVANHATATLTPAQTALLPYAQRSLANFGLLEYIPIASVQISETGINRAENSNFKTGYKYQINDLKDSFVQGGYDSLELMLAFMEANKIDYPDWESEARAKSKELFINSAKEFKQAYDILKGRYNYDGLRSIIYDLECFSILPNIGDPYFDELKAQILADTLTAPNVVALNFIQKAVAYFTIREAVRKNWGRITPDGFQSFSKFEAQSYQGESPATQRVAQVKIEQGDEMGNRFVSKLLKLLIGNSTDYPTFNTWYDEEQAAKLVCPDPQDISLDCPCDPLIGDPSIGAF